MLLYQPLLPLDHVVKDLKQWTMFIGSQAEHGCWAGAGHLQKERRMSTNQGATYATIAILTMADIQAAAAAFDQGDVSVFDALDAVVAAIEAYQAAAQPRREAA